MDVRVPEPDDLTARPAGTTGLLQSLLAKEELGEPERQALLTDPGRPNDGKYLR